MIFSYDFIAQSFSIVIKSDDPLSSFIEQTKCSRSRVRIRDRIRFPQGVVDRSSNRPNRSPFCKRLPQIRLHHSVIEILVTYLPCASIREYPIQGVIYIYKGGTNNSVRREREQERADYRKIDGAWGRRGRGRGRSDR